MKVAVLSDIHGNHYALSAVLDSAKKNGVSQLLILGDIVGYYYYPEIVLELLSEWQYKVIKGNHEDLLLDLLENRIDRESLIKKYGKGHQEALRKLDKKTIDWLVSLPDHQSVVVDGVLFQLNHGSPWDSNTYLYPDTKSEILAQCDSERYDFVLIGHSHYAFTCILKNSILLNPGSVGQSRDKGGIANWAIVNTKNRCLELKSTPYDVSELILDVERLDPDLKYSKEVLLR
ncbi:MAG: metallophosphoesterase family protein [Pedobacter sp.]|nr:metallophosphoesterase family protein [Pedobacter sp.]